MVASSVIVPGADSTLTATLPSAPGATTYHVTYTTNGLHYQRRHELESRRPCR